MSHILKNVLPIIEKFAPFLAKALMLESPMFGHAIDALLSVFGSPLSHDQLEQAIQNSPNVQEQLTKAEDVYKTHLSSADIDIKLNFEPNEGKN